MPSPIADFDLYPLAAKTITMTIMALLDSVIPFSKLLNRRVVLGAA